MTKDIRKKQGTMKPLVLFVNAMVEPLVPDYLKKYLKGIKIYRVKIKSKLEIADKLNDDESITPDLSDSYLKMLAVKDCQEGEYENIKIFHYFPEELDSLKDFYFFAIFAVFSHDNGRLSKGYISDLSDDYFKKEAFYSLLNTNTLTAMYVSRYLHSRKLPADTLFTALSAEQYEKSDSYAKIIFTDCPESCNWVYQFEEKYELSEGNLRTIRKLMEITKNPDAKESDTEKSDLALVAVKNSNDTWSVVGTAEATKSNTTIKFKGNLNWSFSEDEKEKFLFYKGRYILNLGEEKQEYETQITAVPKRYQGIVRNLVGILKKQKHGTVAIISTKIHLVKEITRLCKMNKGIRIKEFDFSNPGADNGYAHQMGMTNIDGAVFIDNTGKCHAIGVVVDGETVVKGDAGRGARYNSVNNYVEWLYQTKQEYFIGIIISEDGMINIVRPKTQKQKKGF